MAFKDITKVLYDGSIKLDYKDKAHRYYVRERIDYDLPEDDKKAWGKVIYPKGTTTLLGDTLEKKGLMQWPKREALKELFGFYESFTGEDGSEVPAGFSKGVGTLWDKNGNLLDLSKKESVEIINSASTNWRRRQKKGADIGSVVHDAIEHFIKNEEFDLAENYSWGIKEAYESGLASIEKLVAKGKTTDQTIALMRKEVETQFKTSTEEFDADVEMAKTAYLEFQKWWLTVQPKLYGAEDILYSREYNVCGTYDGDIGVPVAFHPVYSKFPLHELDEKGDATEVQKELIRVVADWKTSKAHKEAPEGVNYDYFIQSAIYELIRREMGFDPADDLLIVSARKDGGFNPIYASEVGYTVEDCIEWAKAVIFCYRMREKGIKGLAEHAKPKEEVNTKEKF